MSTSSKLSSTDLTFTNATGSGVLAYSDSVFSSDRSLAVNGTIAASTISIGDNASLVATSGVSGPASATDNAIARFDSTTGKVIQGSSATLSDTGQLAGLKEVSLDGATSGTLTIKPSNTTTSHTISLPSAQGAAGALLANDGSGNLSWTAQLAGLDQVSMNGNTSGTLTIRASSATTSHTIRMPSAQGDTDTLLLNDGNGNLSWKKQFVAGYVNIGDIGGGTSGSISRSGDITSATKSNGSFGSSGSQITVNWTALGRTPKSVVLQAAWNGSNSFNSDDNDLAVPLVRSLSDSQCVFQLEETGSGTQDLGMYVTVFY